eukprot:TRINITY_DN6861_c0_g1_i2.p1 TRINITY_DN6861_c0_g1~~TRINITY_DN6861_c0_g1_i2.p1  ORF type:complete len:435 (+),score=117.45 TRINITY_DN6861_c0_g1_i2:138-1307(+)
MQHGEQLATALFKYTSSIDTIIHPLDDFAGKYESYNKKALLDASKVLEEVGDRRKNIGRAKDKYFREGKQAMNCSSELSYKNKLRVVEECKKEYKNLLTKFNLSAESSKKKYIKSLEAWKRNEESKMILVKSTLNSFEQFGKEIEEEWASSLLVYGKALEAFKDCFDVELYVPAAGEKCLVFNEIEFEVPDEDLNSLKEAENGIVKTFPFSVKNTDIEFVTKEIKNLLADRVVAEEDKATILKLIKTNECLAEVCKVFLLLSRKINLNNEEAFSMLGEIATVVVKLLAEHKYPEAGYVAAIVNLGSQVSCTQQKASNNKFKSYLREAFMDHAIWRSKNIWDRIAEYRIYIALEFLEAISSEREDRKGRASTTPKTVSYTHLTLPTSDLV